MKPELEDLAEVRQYVQDKGNLRGVIVQGVDLRCLTETLGAVDVSGSVFLGCTVEDGVASRMVSAGAVVFPGFPALPYEPYRPKLYTPDALLEGMNPGDPQSFWTSSKDALIFAHFDRFRSAGAKTPVLEALAQRLHDHAVDDALQDFLAVEPRARRGVVALMGGHSLPRGGELYRAAARIARALADEGYLLASGGGPGAMEATHLGAWFAGRPLEALEDAQGLLAPARTFRDPAWLPTALAVREKYPVAGAVSLAIPTWFYGHEPTNVFPTHVAKYFSNSLREDGLLTLARAGVIYTPGSAGTVSEVFLDACQNHYNSVGVVSPMVFLGKAFWTDECPAFPLLEKLARGKPYHALLHVTDDETDAVAFLKAHPAV